MPKHRVNHRKGFKEHVENNHWKSQANSKWPPPLKATKIANNSVNFTDNDLKLEYSNLQHILSVRPRDIARDFMECTIIFKV